MKYAKMTDLLSKLGGKVTITTKMSFSRLDEKIASTTGAEALPVAVEYMATICDYIAQAIEQERNRPLTIVEKMGVRERELSFPDGYYVAFAKMMIHLSGNIKTENSIFKRMAMSELEEACLAAIEAFKMESLTK